MRWLVTALFLAAMATSAIAAEVQSIDDFEYPDAAAANAVWEASQGAPPAEMMSHESAGGRTALRIPCPFTRDMERACYDRKGSLNLLRAGAIADVVVFDEARFKTRATYLKPHVYAEGMDTVIINGRLALSQGKPTGVLAGKVLGR